MGYGSRAFLAGGLGFAAAFVVACGSSNGLLSPAQSSTLASQLNSISSAVEAGRCTQAQGAATALTNAVNNLPGTIDPTLIRNLVQGATTVSQLASTGCTRSTSSSTSTPATTTSSSTTIVTSSVPTTSSSTPTTPTSTSTSSANTATGTSSSGTSTTSNGGAGVGGGTTSTGTGGGNG